MSLWDVATEVFDFASKNSGSLLNVGATIAGTVIASNANDEAAKKTKEANDAYVAAVTAGNQQAQSRYDDLIGRTQPGTDALQRIVVEDPYTLTPEQKLKQEDVRRSTTTALNKSGLRGSGRAVLEALRGVESDYVANAVDTNLNRRDSAARTLSGQAANATGAAAGLDASTGKTTGEGALTSGYTSANADTANANLRGQALGDIAGIIASDEKAKGRGSKYADNTDNRQVTVSRV